MEYSAENCTAELIMPGSPDQIKYQFDLLMNIARQICPVFTGHIRRDDGLILVPACRSHASKQKNLITVWWNGSSLKFDIRPRPKGVLEPQKFSDHELSEYHQRLAARFELLRKLQ